MKLLKITILAVVASLFTFPAAAVNIQQEVDLKIVLSGSVAALDSVKTSTIWNAVNLDEFLIFDAEEVRWDVDFFNAELTSSDCELNISVFDDDGALLDANNYDCVIDSSDSPLRIKIHPADTTHATEFVAFLFFNEPDAVKVVMSLEIDVEQIDVEQQSIAMVDFRWGGAKIADGKTVQPKF